jgi:hypothetical protein
VGAKLFPPLVKAALGDIGAPWTWEYGEKASATTP